MLQQFQSTHNFLNVDPSKLRETLMNMKVMGFECECNNPLHRVALLERGNEIFEYYMEEWTLGETKVQIQRRPGLKPFVIVLPVNGMISEVDELLLELKLREKHFGRIEDIYKESLGIDISKLDIITFDCPPMSK